MNLTTLKKLENPLQGVSIACVLTAKLRVGSLLRISQKQSTNR